MRLAAAALVAGLLYLLVALTGLGATALAQPAPDAIHLAGQSAAIQPRTLAPSDTPSAPILAATQVPHEVSVGRPVQAVPSPPRPAQVPSASPDTSTGNPLVDDTTASPTPTQGDALLPGVVYVLTPVVPDVTATALPTPVPTPVPTPAPTPVPSPTTPGLLGGLFGRS